MEPLKFENYEYSSVFMNEIVDYLKFRRSKGYKKRDKAKQILKSVDTFLCKAGLKERAIPASYIDEWLATLPGSLTVATKSAYISGYSGFAKYLNIMNINAFVPECLKSGGNYIPYIFTHEEMKSIFSAADNMTVYKGLNRLTPLQFPILLRMLYGCGLRLGEALSLKVSDMDFDNGVIFIRNAKGDKDRLVPMDESLTRICRGYRAVMRSEFSKSDALFFANKNGKQYSQTWPQKSFRKVLANAGIERFNLAPHRRNICLHCLRHTFAVDSFKKLDDEGMDSYASSPLLSVYLGHTHFYHTEIYLHMTEEVHKSIVDKTSSYTKHVFPEVPTI